MLFIYFYRLAVSTARSYVMMVTDARKTLVTKRKDASIHSFLTVVHVMTPVVMMIMIALMINALSMVLFPTFIYNHILMFAGCVHTTLNCDDGKNCTKDSCK